jgi:hypothetical protein
MKITKFLSAVLLILTGCFGGEQKQTPQGNGSYDDEPAINDTSRATGRNWLMYSKLISAIQRRKTVHSKRKEYTKLCFSLWTATPTNSYSA